MPPPTIAMRDCVPLWATAASCASGPPSAAAPTVAPVAFRKSRRLRRTCRRSSCTASTARPDRSASSKSSKRAWNFLSSGVRGTSLLPGGMVARLQERPEGIAPLRPKKILGNADRRDDLLLEMPRVGAVVVGADRGRVVVPGAGDVAVIVADEPFRSADPAWLHRVELRVPGMAADPDVVALRDEVGLVELDAGVDTVVGRAVGRQGPGEPDVGRVQREAGARGLSRVRCRAEEAAVVEGDHDRAVSGGGEVRLERVDEGIPVVVDLDRGRPCLAAVVRRAQDDVAKVEAVVLPRHIKRELAIERLRADRKRALDQ